jgi:hypothetical protein
LPRRQRHRVGARSWRDGETTFDPVSQSVLVRVVGLGGRYWRRGHQAMMEDAGVNGPPPVFARVGGKDVGCGEAVRGGWLRFKLSDADYRKLTGRDLGAIAVVDKGSAAILAVRFLDRSRP